jgi:hypothetical protein
MTMQGLDSDEARRRLSQYGPNLVAAAFTFLFDAIKRPAFRGLGIG